MSLVIKAENPAGYRIQELTVGGAHWTPDQPLAVAFLGKQAVPEEIGRDRRSTGIRAVEALAGYLRKARIVAPAVEGRVKLA
jgi:hypothetical protein